MGRDLDNNRLRFDNGTVLRRRGVLTLCVEKYLMSSKSSAIVGEVIEV
jgi:hypothetical protein